MLHLPKSSRFSSLASREKKKYDTREAYYDNLANGMLDWNTLSNKGTLFDPKVLEAAVEEKKIMHRKGDILIIRLKTVKVPKDQLSTTSFEEAAQYSALHF